MDYLDMVAEMLGVEIDKPFKCSGKNDIWYKISRNGAVSWDAGTNRKEWHKDYVIWGQLLAGLLEVEEFPTIGEVYFYPHPIAENLIAENVYKNNDFDRQIKRNLGLFRTEEEAREEAVRLGWVQI